MTPEERLAGFLRGIEQLPPARVIAFRGCPEGATLAVPRDVSGTDRVVSASLDLAVATDGYAVRTAYAIASLSGRSIEQFSAAPEQHEIVWAPGVAFLLGRTFDEAGLRLHLVLELTQAEGQWVLPSEDVLDRLETAVRDRVREQLPQGAPDRAGSAGAAATPSKFVGDLA